MKDRFFTEDGKIIHHRVIDPNPALDQAAALRSAGITGYSENALIGRVPMALVTEWLKEAGVTWDDPAMEDVLMRKLMDGDFSKFRVWQGGA